MFTSLGHDKLKPYGFPIHGAIDGYSCKILWLEMTKGAFHSVKISEISGQKSNGTGKVPERISENLGLPFGLTLLSPITEFSVFHS